MSKPITKKVVFIRPDQDAASPREEDNLGTIAYKHPRYILGDEAIDDPIDWLADKLGLGAQSEHNNTRLRELEERFIQDYVALPVYLYDHSGLALSTESFSCPWDSGQIGWIYVSKHDAQVEYGWSELTDAARAWVERVLRAEVAAFSRYLAGDIYGFQAGTAQLDDGGDVLEETFQEEQSMWGFYGADPQDNGMMAHIREYRDAQFIVRR